MSVLLTGLATAAGYLFAQALSDISTARQTANQRAYTADAAKVQALYETIINNYSSQVANIDKYLSQYDLKLSDFKDLANHSSRISTLNAKLNRVLGDYQKVRAKAQGTRDNIQRLVNQLSSEANKRVTELNSGNYSNSSTSYGPISFKDPEGTATNAIASTIVDYKTKYGDDDDNKVLNEINTSLSTLHENNSKDGLTQGKGGN